jgi:hypothetical protein
MGEASWSVVGAMRFPKSADNLLGRQRFRKNATKSGRPSVYKVHYELSNKLESLLWNNETAAGKG